MKKIILFFYFFVPFILVGQNSQQISLAGEWRFDLDPMDKGEKEQWFVKRLSNKIQLPGITDEGEYGVEVIEEGKLSRLYKYIGKAWYQTDIFIPDTWKDKNIRLDFERIMWKSQLWIGDRYMGFQESLSTPHIYDLGKLTPGKHTLTLCIDNREIYPIGNLWGHSYGEQTQIIWNGIIGEMKMYAQPDVLVRKIRTFPDDKGNLDIEVNIVNNSTQQQKIELYLELTDRQTGKIVRKVRSNHTVLEGHQRIIRSIKIVNPRLWDEFSPALYKLNCSIKSKFGSEEYTPIVFGFRTIGKTEDYITINGLRRFLRGNLDCAVFPLAGYPYTQKDDWMRILKLYRDYGLNHVRFHSWTPPKAAFEAADELGLYVLSEIFWRDGWMGKGLDVDSVEPFLRPELKRIADTYGDHPSLVMLALGNELGGFDRNRMDPWIKEVKEHDPRHFYSVSVRRPPTAHADINFQGDLSSPYPLLFINQKRFSTDWDYAQWYGKASSLPSIQHEVGQWVFYPDWNEIDKYTGTLRARSMELFRDLAKQRGVYEQNKEFIQSSGLQSLNLYKENIESLLRTPLCGGFQLLGMQDFTGQGVALIGWLDAFYENKGIVTPDRFRNWCNTTVPLMRAPSYVYTNRDTLKVKVEIFHFAQEDIKNAQINWSIKDEDGYTWEKGVFTCDINNTELTPVGEVCFALEKIKQSRKLLFEVAIQGSEFKNDWNFWVFSENAPEKIPNPVIETYSVSEAIDHLRNGEKVILWAHQLGSSKNAGYAYWKPTFWQAGGHGNEGFVNGAVIRNHHPALKGFPTDYYLDFQWTDICEGARGFDLEGLPSNIRPIVQPIHDFRFNRKLGSIIEFISPEGGLLLICGYNLVDSLEIRPAARVLKNSLMQYVSSPGFKPVDMLDYDWMKRELYDINGIYLPPSEFENAFLYVKAGGRHQKNGLTEWSMEKDASALFETDKYGYRVKCDKIIVDESFSAWQGDDIQLDLKIPFDFDGKIKIYLSNPDQKERKGNILFNGKEIYTDPIPVEGKWITLEMNPGDALLGTISVLFQSLTEYPLLISEIAVTI